MDLYTILNLFFYWARLAYSSPIYYSTILTKKEEVSSCLNSRMKLGPKCFLPCICLYVYDPRVSSSWFLNLGTTDLWGQIILCYGVCAVHCWMFSSIPGLYPLDTCSIPPTPSHDKKNISRHYNMCRRTKSPLLKATGLVLSLFTLRLSRLMCL